MTEAKKEWNRIVEARREAVQKLDCLVLDKSERKVRRKVLKGAVMVQYVNMVGSVQEQLASVDNVQHVILDKLESGLEVTGLVELV